VSAVTVVLCYTRRCDVLGHPVRVARCSVEA
jgi:hypothetical protein